MQVKTKEKKENPLLLRTEVNGTITFTGATPNFDALKKELIKELKTTEDLIAVKGIYTKFGFPEATFRAYAYKTKEQLELIEPKKKEKKKPQAAAQS